MKFFKISSEDRGNVLPQIRGWMDKLDYHTVQAGEIWKLPKRTLLYVDNHPETVFADILNSPFLLVSNQVWKLMKKYDNDIKGKQIVLLDDIYGIAEIYYIPELQQYTCFNVEQDKAAMPPFLKWNDGKSSFMVGRLDFVESILRRGAKGIQLQEFDMEEFI